MSVYVEDGDITNFREKVDVIVVPANRKPVLGNALDAKIYQWVEGRDLAEKSRLLARRKAMGDINLGEAMPMGVDACYRNKVMCLMHTVPPAYVEDKKDDIQRILESCYKESIRYAYILGYTSIAFPILSSGTLEWPQEDAVKIAKETCDKYLKETKINMSVYLIKYKETASWRKEKRDALEKVPQNALGRGTFAKTEAQIYEEYLQETPIDSIIHERYEKITSSKCSPARMANITGISSTTMERIIKGDAKKRDYVWCIALALNFNTHETKLLLEKFALGAYELIGDVASEINKENEREKIIKAFIDERHNTIDMQRKIEEEDLKEIIAILKDELDSRLENAGFRKLMANKDKPKEQGSAPQNLGNL